MESITENIYVNRDLQNELFGSVCSKYGLTRMELLILLFLSRSAKNTATDIVERLRVAKSHVSASVRELEEQGYIEPVHEGSDHRAVHLRLLDKADEIIRAGERAQEEFISIVCRGFSQSERRQLMELIVRMNANVIEYFKNEYRHRDSGRPALKEVKLP